MKPYISACIIMAAVLVSCNKPSTYTQGIEDDFNARVAEVGIAECFDIFNTDLTDEQRVALQMLYANMPLPDITDYTGEYYLENVDLALRARNEMPWGSIVPDREFYHFVLPVRVNNEDLDHHRRAFYEELKPRLEGLSMEEAILEVNHWCHEKATYQPSDSRTHSPLATVSSAIGRCGEESTFTVAALRSVGIPARQVYTPRWAHTDDNHAWVEAWANGKWYFLGACEPEAVLNLGWFNAPASRGMLMNTRVFGKYKGSEEALVQAPTFTEINVTDIYAPVDTIRARVVDANGNEVADANVNFCLYNYAEFFPIARKKTDSQGMASLTTGLGDMLVWASDGDMYGYSKVRACADSVYTVALTASMTAHSDMMVVDFDITPPAARDAQVTVSDEMAAANDMRKAREDSIRNAYMRTFVDADSAAAIAAKLGVDAQRMASIMADARGNSRTLLQFLATADNLDKAMVIVEALSAKDRSDVTAEVLADQMLVEATDEAYALSPYVLSARVDNEMATPFNKLFYDTFTPEQRQAFAANPDGWLKWVADSIEIVPNWQPSTVKMSAASVLRYRKTNAVSRDIFAVRSLRALGLPARMDLVRGVPQMLDAKGQWADIKWGADDAAEQATPKGKLKLTYAGNGIVDNPGYYTQFTISKLVNGLPQLLNYDDNATLNSDFKGAVDMDPGKYMLVTGQRLASGGVLSRTVFFDITEGATTTVPLEIRHDDKAIQVIGSFDAESIYHDAATGTDKTLLSSTGRGYYIIAIIAPNHEPTTHVLKDLTASKADFEDWGKSIVLLFPTEADMNRVDASTWPKLPSTAIIGCDIDGQIRQQLCDNLKLSPAQLPIFVIADTFNRVVYATQGYNIEAGAMMRDIVKQIGQ